MSDVQPIRVGVIGAGLISQVMHLQHLREMPELFTTTALCDLSLDTATEVASRFGIPNVYTDWAEMLNGPVDAVLVLSSGCHAEPAIAAANLGKHVFVEKPMAFSVASGIAMRDAAKKSKVQLMVAYPKRYDPAFERFCEEVNTVIDPRMLRVTTFESPIAPYVSQYPLYKGPALPEATIQRLNEESHSKVVEAIGDSSEFLQNIYHGVLLDTLVHEINTVRGALGEPDSLDAVDLRDGCVSITLSYQGRPAIIHWVDLPTIARYSMEFTYIGTDKRVELDFPSPFVRNLPTQLEIQSGDPVNGRSWSTNETVSYLSAFKLELQAFHNAITTGKPAITHGDDGIRDLALCEAIIKCAETGKPILRPTDFTS